MLPKGHISQVFSPMRFDVIFTEGDVPPQYRVVDILDDDNNFIGRGTVWKHQDTNRIWNKNPKNWVRCWGETHKFSEGMQVVDTGITNRHLKRFGQALSFAHTFMNRLGFPKAKDYVQTLPVWHRPEDAALLNILDSIMDDVVNQLGFEAAMLATYEPEHDVLPCHILKVKPGREWVWEWSEEFMGVTVVGNIIELEKYPDHLVTKAVRAAAAGEGAGYVLTPRLYDLWGHAYSNFTQDRRLVGLMQRAVPMRMMVEIPFVARNENGELRLVGNMFAGHRKRRIPTRDLAALMAFVGQASFAIQNAQLLSIEKQQRELEQNKRLLAEAAKQVEEQQRILAEGKATLAEQQAQLAEERAREVETMAAMGQLVTRLGHRMNNNLGLVRQRMSRFIRTAIQQELLSQDDIAFLKDVSSRISSELEAVREAGRPFEKPMPMPTHVRQLLDEAIAETNLGEGIELTIDESVGTLPSVLGDSDLIEVFRVLLNNANEAMDGQGNITVSATIEGESHVRVAVKDSGIGIDPSEHETIFQLLYTTKETKDGMGLGLWWVRFYLRGLGGNISVESAIDEGATFYVDLPLVSAAALEEA